VLSYNLYLPSLAVETKTFQTLPSNKPLCFTAGNQPGTPGRGLIQFSVSTSLVCFILLFDLGKDLRMAHQYHPQNKTNSYHPTLAFAFSRSSSTANAGTNFLASSME
jgi:hypothetical protein